MLIKEIDDPPVLDFTLSTLVIGEIDNRYTRPDSGPRVAGGIPGHPATTGKTVKPAPSPTAPAFHETARRG
jgi:hypothetical protein